MTCQHPKCQSEAIYHDQRGWFCGSHWAFLPELVQSNLVSESPKRRPRIKSYGALKHRIDMLEEALARLIHACEDSVDHYTRIGECCAEGKALLPDYDERPIFADYE